VEGFTKKGESLSRFHATLSKEDALSLGNTWLVLRNKTRLRILYLLKQYGGLLCVSEIARVLDENPSTISQHLVLLRASGLVTREQYHTYAYYSLKDGAFEAYKRWLEQF
jgi:DNA-binding transcriptional ArsR family regulator